jgi:hypothetical protein
MQDHLLFLLSNHETSRRGIFRVYAPFLTNRRDGSGFISNLTNEKLRTSDPSTDVLATNHEYHVTWSLWMVPA